LIPDDLVLTPRGLRFRGVYYPCTIGKGGLSDAKREGDGATPLGRHAIVGMLYRADRIPAPVPWAIPIGPQDVWSDDPRDPDYNGLLQRPHGFSHESMSRADPLYDLVILIGWNWPDAIAGRGSAIFVHQWRRPGAPTEGCIALSRRNLHCIAQNITRRTRLIVG